jgi:hypothetical protein
MQVPVLLNLLEKIHQLSLFILELFGLSWVLICLGWIIKLVHLQIFPFNLTHFEKYFNCSFGYYLVGAFDCGFDGAFRNILVFYILREILQWEEIPESFKMFKGDIIYNLLFVWSFGLSIYNSSLYFSWLLHNFI